MKSSRKFTIGVAGTWVVAVVIAGGGAWAVGELAAAIKVDGTAPSDLLGWSTAAAGDVNGDGVPDVVVSSYGAGYALVVSGADASVIHTIQGDASAEWGYCVAGLGDVNGDGLSDIAVGAPSFKGGLGAVYVYSGSDGSEMNAYYGDNGADYFGGSVALAGDVDADGYPDIVAGARYGQDPNYKRHYPGYAKVISGNSGKQLYIIYGNSSGDDFGTSVCGLGDLNGDKQSEFAVGAEYYLDGKGRTTGLVRIFDGATGSEITSLYGDNDFDLLGTSISLTGDLNGDGVADLIAGAQSGQDPNGFYPGYARVYSSSDWSTIYTVYGDEDYDSLGWSVSGGEDFDGDGVADFAAGAPYAANEGGEYSGGVRIYSGKSGEVIETVYGEKGDDSFGWSATVLPDLTADGAADLLVGAPFCDAGGEDAGTVYLYAEGAPKAPKGAILINADSAATASKDVSLDLSWTDGPGVVIEMRFRDAGGEWGEWMDVASTASWTLPAGDGSKTVEAEFRDDTGVSSAVAADAILLDTAGPSGTVIIDGGAVWARNPSVTLGLTSSDAGSGVARMRVRDAGGVFGEWVAAAASLPWTLPAGNGSKTVEVQFDDKVGNVSSAVISDAISFDGSAPTGSILIAGGATLVTDRNVILTLAASDTGGSGLADMRIRRGDVTTWNEWTPYAATANWLLAPSDGSKVVQAQYRDIAGNESAVFSATVTLDATVPQIDTFGVHEPKPYYLPQEQISFDLAVSDGGGGTGVDVARTSWDGGTSWTPWTDIAGGGLYTPERPVLEGNVSARVVVRDRAGNVSAAANSAMVHFVPANYPDAASGGSGKGSMAAADDIDVIGVDLVKGDILSVSVKAASIPKKQSFVLSLDVATPDGQRLVSGRFPETARAPGIKGFVAPATGRYLLLVRNADTVGTSTGNYTLKIRVKHVKANGAARGIAAAGEFTLDAADGSTFSGTLKGEGLDPASVVVEGPEGAVAVTTRVKKGVVLVNPVKLAAGTGAYTVRFTATGPVTFTWKSVLPKPNVKVVEQQ